MYFVYQDIGKDFAVVLDTTSRLQCRRYRLGQGNLSFRLLGEYHKKDHQELQKLPSSN